MRILVTNDDGIHSEGLWSVVRTLKEAGQVSVVAPDRDQSGMGAAISLISVVRVQEVSGLVDGVKTFAVQGTPGDCVILATETLFSEPFDLVVSGINQGSNLGLDVINSGTVGAAFQGYFRNIPAVALSVASLTDVQYQVAARTATALARAISKRSPSGPLFLNINLPNVGLEKIEGVEMTTLGPRAYLESVEQGGDGRRTHYWIKHDRPASADPAVGTDIWAVKNNRVSITALDLVFTPKPSPNLDFLVDEVIAALTMIEQG